MDDKNVASNTEKAKPYQEAHCCEKTTRAFQGLLISTGYSALKHCRVGLTRMLPASVAWHATEYRLTLLADNYSAASFKNSTEWCP